MNINHLYKLFCICSILLIHSSMIYGSELPINTIDYSVPTNSVAILPFINYTGNYRAIEIMIPQISKILGEKLINVFSPDDIRNILRKYRIRSYGMTSQVDAMKIYDELNVRYLIVGSLDYFNDVDKYEVGLSLRVIEISTMKIIYAKSHASSDIDYMKIFGIGRVNDISVLTEKVLQEMLDDLSVQVLEQRSANNSNKYKIAVINFENLSNTQKADGIITNQVISYLQNSNYDLVEPGILHDFMLKHNHLFQGEIDLKTIAKLKKNFGIDYIVTGTVENFKFSRGNLGEIGPEVLIWLRVLDASNNKLIFMNDSYKNGENSEVIFKLGKCYTLGRLVNSVIDNVLDKFLKDSNYATIDKK